MLCKCWLLILSHCHFYPRLTGRLVVDSGCLSILTGEAPPFPQECGPLGSAHPFHRSQQEEILSISWEPLNDVVSRAPTLVTRSYLALRTQPCQPACWVASHKDKLQGVPVAPAVVLASFPWGVRAKLCQSRMPLPLAQVSP